MVARPFRSRDLSVYVHEGRVWLEAGEPIAMTPLEVGRLRGVLRDAVFALADNPAEGRHRSGH